MTLYKVKLNAWTSPVWVQAGTMKAAKELALKNYPTCGCCGAKTYVEAVRKHDGEAPLYTSIIVEVKQ